jgi:hypothetical protein
MGRAGRTLVSMDELYLWKSSLDAIIADRESLLAMNKDLLAALKALMPEGWADDDTMDHMPGVKQARAAILAAEAAP